MPPPPPSPPLTNLLLLLLVLPLLSSSSFSSTLDEVKESLLEREGLRSLASFLSFNPSEDTEDVEEGSLAMSSSRKPPKPIQKASSSSLSDNHGSVIGPHWLVLKESRPSPPSSSSSSASSTTDSSKRADGMLGGLFGMVKTVRFITDPANLANLFG